MNTIDILRWIKTNLGSYIRTAIAGTIYTEEWLAGITCREVGELIAKFAPHQSNVLIVCSLMRGDYSRRPGEVDKGYHGYGLTQIDITSFPDFVHSGDWKDPSKVYPMTIKVLESKRHYLVTHFPAVAGDSLNHYITAAYNCGEGNEAKVIAQERDPDAYTTGHDYSKAVFEFADQYKTL